MKYTFCKNIIKEEDSEEALERVRGDLPKNKQEKRKAKSKIKTEKKDLSKKSPQKQQKQ